MWLEFIAASARLPMLGKGKMFQVKCKCQLDFLPPEPQPNSIPSAQWHFRPAGHIANAYVGRSLKVSAVIDLKMKFTLFCHRILNKLNSIPVSNRDCLSISSGRTRRLFLISIIRLSLSVFFNSS